MVVNDLKALKLDKEAAFAVEVLSIN